MINRQMFFVKLFVKLLFFHACFSIDSLLDGGLYTGQVTELAGDIAVGKTQVLETVQEFPAEKA